MYKFTSIESSFGFNTLAIVDSKPKTCNLKDFIENFLKFREDVVIKKTKFELKKAEERAHILIGLSVSVENLDKVIKIIRNSKTPNDAKNALFNLKWKISKSSKLINLIENTKKKNLYSLSEPQVLSILELKLQKLTALGINEIEIEIKKLAELIFNYKKIINSKKDLLKVIRNELINIKDKFSVPRRTKIIDAILNYDIEETIQKESVILTVTAKNYIKRGALSNVKQQKRGGKGKSGIKTRDEDSVVQTLSVNTHSSVLFFSSEGVLEFLIIFITLSKFSTETESPINIWALSSAFFSSNFVFLITTSSLNFKKFSMKSLRLQVFGLLSTIANVLKPNELSIDVNLYNCLFTVSGST